MKASYNTCKVCGCYNKLVSSSNLCSFCQYHHKKTPKKSTKKNFLGDYGYPDLRNKDYRTESEKRFDRLWNKILRLNAKRKCELCNKNIGAQIRKKTNSFQLVCNECMIEEEI